MEPHSLPPSVKVEELKETGGTENSVKFTDLNIHGKLLVQNR